MAVPADQASSSRHVNRNRRDDVDKPPAAAYEHEYPGASWLASMTAGELVVVAGLVDNAIAAVTRRYGLSHAAGNALAVIEGNGGPLPAGEVSARMQVTSGTTTSLLDTLERKGLIQRSLDPRDRRRVLVDVTPSAHELLDRMLPEVEQLFPLMFTGLTKEQHEQLLTSLRTVHQAVADLPDDLPPPKPRRTPSRLRRSPEAR